MRQTTCVFAALILGIATSCQQAENNPEPVKLACGLESYMTIAAAKDLISSRGLDWIVIENSSEQRGASGRPQFDVVSAEVKGQIDLGVKGTVRLEFLNDRLMATWFYPVDPSAYKAKIKSSHPKFEEGKSLLSGKTIVRSGKDYKRQEYVVWEDPRLRKEFDRWIEKHAIRRPTKGGLALLT